MQLPSKKIATVGSAVHVGSHSTLTKMSAANEATPRIIFKSTQLTTVPVEFVSNARFVTGMGLAPVAVNVADTPVAENALHDMLFWLW